MGIPVDPCYGAGTSPAPPCRQRPCGVASDKKEPAATAIGCRTPPRRQQEGAAGGGDGARVVLVCPPAPRKKRRGRPAPAGGAQRATEFYAGADLEAFFAAHNL